MMRMMLRVSLTILAFALSGCSGGGGIDSSRIELPRSTLDRPKQPSPTIHVDRGPGKPMTLTGTLGILNVEGGCSYLENDKGTRYEVLFPTGWDVDKSTGELIDPTGDVSATAGDTVTVKGEIATDMASICQIGPIFRADQVVEVQRR